MDESDANLRKEQENKNTAAKDGRWGNEKGVSRLKTWYGAYKKRVRKEGEPLSVG